MNIDLQDKVQQLFTPVPRDDSLLRQHCLIDGIWATAGSTLHYDVVNPSTDQVIATIASGDERHARNAVQAAQAALPSWKALTADERSRILYRWYELVVGKRDDLALILTLEQGKPLAEAASEIDYAASYIQWFAEEGRRASGGILPSPWPDKRLLVTREPIGVCAAITPWNFPAAMVTRKVAPALAAGCTIVLKPASQTPLTALALAELAMRAGVPPGVLNVVVGSAAAIGNELTSNPLVRKLTFTGSTEVGRRLAASCAPTVKRLSLELGGNAPFIVLDDADIDAAVQGAIAAKFRNAGQTCVCANRFLVQSSVHDVFLNKLSVAAQALQVSDGQARNAQIGPLIDRAAVERLDSLIDEAMHAGADLVLGGGRHERGGNFFQPTIIAAVTSEMTLAKQEIFGPVAAIQRFDTDEQAIQIANATEYGLAAYLYTSDLKRSWRTSDALEYGMVGINTGVISTAAAPFGGIKQSGYGREGSTQGLDDYLETKYRCVGGL